LLQSKGVEITGFDPTYEDQNPSIVKHYFEKGVDIQAKGLVLHHVLEHIQDPVEFLKELNTANTEKGKIYIEAPCLDYIVKNNAWFDVFYEHVNYFRLPDLNKMFGNVIESGTLFGGQYIYIVVELSSIQQPIFDANTQAISNFNFNFNINKGINVNPLVVWGGASKGVIYSLHKIRAGHTIDMVIDINPAKQGKYLPGSGFLVSSPEDAICKLSKGDTIIIMNPNYRGEIIEMTDNRYFYVDVE